MKMAIAAGFSAICLAGLSAGVPAAMAAGYPAPTGYPAPAGPPAPGNGPVAVDGEVPDAAVMANGPAVKEAALRAENRLRQAAAGRPLVAPGYASPAGPAGESHPGQGPRSAAIPAPAAAHTAGILPLTAGGPFRSAQFLGTNLWNGPAGGRWEIVQAGGVPVDRALGAASPEQAGLFVYTETSDPAAPAAPRIIGVRAPSPDPAGTFTVTSATGSLLTLTLSGSGAVYSFDVATLRFTG
jgi:hypothetical protein